MPSTCEFQLNHPNGVYYSGDTIISTIILSTTSTKEVREICIIFRGEGKVSWTQAERRRKANGRFINSTIYYRSNDLYVENSTKVYGEGSLPPGTHIYTYEIDLPLECPTSCEARYGHIRYELTLKLDRSLTIIKAQDLNLDPAYRLPLACEDTFSSCWFSCSDGFIHIILSTPFSGYAIGQNVKYGVFVENQTMDDIDGYTEDFYRKITYTARTPHLKTHEENTTLHSKTNNTPCLRLTKRIYNGNFLIDSTPPSTEGSNSIIRVEYFLKVTLHVNACNKDKELAITLFIGTVPLRESMLPTAPLESDRLVGLMPTAPEQAQETQTDTDLPPSYKELGPPSFEEATRCSTPFVDHDIDEHHRHVGFRPLYPTYSQSDD